MAVPALLSRPGFDHPGAAAQEVSASVTKARFVDMRPVENPFTRILEEARGMA